jgi:hypothetical protein
MKLALKNELSFENSTTVFYSFIRKLMLDHKWSYTIGAFSLLDASNSLSFQNVLANAANS